MTDRFEAAMQSLPPKLREIALQIRDLGETERATAIATMAIMGATQVKHVSERERFDLIGAALDFVRLTSALDAVARLVNPSTAKIDETKVALSIVELYAAHDRARLRFLNLSEMLKPSPAVAEAAST